MSAPNAMPTWATDANYASGDDEGLPTRSEPTSGEKASGFFRGKRAPARKVNWVLGLICDWVAWLEECRVDPKITTIPSVVARSGNLTSVTGAKSWEFRIGQNHARQIFYAEQFTVSNTSAVTWELNLPFIFVATPAITEEYQVVGSGVAVSNTTGAVVPVEVIGQVSTGRAACKFISPLAANYKIRLSFDYAAVP